MSLRRHPIDSMKHGSAAGGIASRQTTLRAGGREGVGERAGEQVGERRFVDLASVSARAEPPRSCAVVPLCGGRVRTPVSARAEPPRSCAVVPLCGGRVQTPLKVRAQDSQCLALARLAGRLPPTRAPPRRADFKEVKGKGAQLCLCQAGQASHNCPTISPPPFPFAPAAFGEGRGRARASSRQCTRARGGRRSG